MARADELFEAGLKRHQAGDLAGAEPLYVQALAADPNHQHSLNVMGALAHQLGRYGEAVAFYDRVIALNPRVPAFHINRGLTLHAQGKLEEAAAAHRAAVALKPAAPDAHFNLGNVLLSQEHYAEAEACYRRAIGYHRNYAEAYGNLGVALQHQGRLEEANESLRMALGLKPDLVDAWNNLSTVLLAEGRHAEAMMAVERALALKPDFAQAHFNHANLLDAGGRLNEAILAHQRALAIDPAYVEVHNNLGNVLTALGRLEEATAAFRKALALAPDRAATHNNLGNALKEQGRLDEAVESYRRATTLNPASAVAGANLALSLNYGAAITPEEVFAEHRRWGEVHGERPRPAAYLNDRDPDRRIRIGFVSGDFRAHSVAYFLEPLLRAFDRTAVEVFAYAEVVNPDPVTERLMGLSDHWRLSMGLTDEGLAMRIAADRIDILIDLAGHTDRNRLLAFARKPAPIQASWLGYPHTTGLEAVDYRIVDPITDPPGSADAFAVEKLVRLEGGFLCYAPPEEAPEPDLPPSLVRGVVTFGSFNNPVKLSGRTISVWADILAAVPNSRLLLKGRPFADPGACTMLEARFATRGIEASRLILKSYIAGGHLGAYGEVDVALDPFPYNGTTTTCEALWMGVPVVALRGDRHAGRVGASLLTHVGLEVLIAESAHGYIELAAGLGGDPDRLSELRKGLRRRYSPIRDP